MRNRNLANRLISEGYLRSRRIIRAFQKIDRKLFVLRPEEACLDHPLPIPGGQTISAPHMVAIMLELLEPKKTDSILEIGAGSGYSAALLGTLAKKVTSIEVDKVLVAFAKRNLKKAKIKNVIVIHGDGSLGFPKAAPYDKIIFTCAVPKIPKAVISQLKYPGLLLAPVGGEFYQDLILLRKKSGKLKKENHGGCVFVPLRKVRKFL